MVYTGLRISDVGLFQMDRLKGNEFSSGQETAARYSPSSRLAA